MGMTLRKMVLMKNLERSIPFALLIGVFIFTSLYTTSSNIHGDGLIHTVFAREIIKTGDLLQYDPYSIVVIDGVEIINYPVYYPQTAHVMMALFYMLGGDELLKYFSPFFAALTSLYIYLLLRPVNKFGAFFASISGIILNSPRFIMTPLIEQPLLFAMMSSLYFYYMFLKKQNRRDLLLAGLFLGLTLAIKQQGFYFIAVLFVCGALIGIYKESKKTNRNEMKLLERFVFIFIIVVALLVSSAPLIDQIQRNGILMVVHGHSIPPFLESKYHSDSEAIQITRNRLGYQFNYESPIESLNVYFLQPLYYNHALSFLRNETKNAVLWGILFSILFAFGIIYMFKKDKLLSSLIVFIFGVVVTFSYLTNTYYLQYHNIGVVILGMCLSLGLFYIKNVIKALKIHRMVTPLTILVVITAVTCSYINEIHQPLWKHSGRYDDDHLNAYKKMGDYVQKNTPKEAIFLTSDTGFKFYSERRTVWVSEWGNAKVPLIFETENEEEALYWLAYYNISYIFIDQRQTMREGLNDYISPHGLLKYIESSPHFRKMYSNPNKETLMLYKVLY